MLCLIDGPFLANHKTLSLVLIFLKFAALEGTMIIVGTLNRKLNSANDPTHVGLSLIIITV